MVYWLGRRSQKLQDLFNRIGPVLKLDLLYDRSGRSDGVAYVTYESHYDAKKAIREFDGANAKGMFISPGIPNRYTEPN
jgi:RNA recognition motif-containing protein